MYSFLLKTTNLFNNISKISKYNNTTIYSYVYEMNKAYLRKYENSEIFEFTFQYKNEELKVDRQFNFNRKLTENIGTFINRVATNLEKTLSKKQKKRKTQIDDIEKNPLSDKICFYDNGILVNSDVTCEELFNSSNDIRMKIIDNEYSIKINTPFIKSASLPTSILANFPVYPNKFETLFMDKNLSEFTWYKSIDKKNWIKLGNEFLYTPTNEDINYYLKINCLPKNPQDTGIITEVISTNKVQADPGQCPFEIRHKFTEEKLTGKNFRIVTYNILADLYSDSDYARDVLFSYCPSYALNMDYRKQLILKELLGYNSDIICLQEVDEKIFNHDLYPVLSYVNLEGIFHKKGGTLREGLACFYNQKRFKLVEENSIIISEEIENNPLLSEIWSNVCKNENLSKRVRDRTTTVQLILLDSIENDKEMILVANTHFYFHPDADHVRLLQGATSIISLSDTKQKISEKYGKKVSLIFCGDFNSTPDCGTYRLYTTGEIPENIEDWKSNTEEMINGFRLQQPTIMLSACGTPKYTNFTVGFKDCLDYIYCEKNSFEVTQVVPLPSDEELTTHQAIPSVLFPSDHIALIADIKLS